MSEVVVDASAILALLNQEPGSETIATLIESASVSAVNLSEVIAKLAESGISEPKVLEIFEHLNLQIIPFDESQALIAGMLRPQTKSLGLSLGDRACLALGITLQQSVITTDRQWKKLDLNRD